MSSLSALLLLVMVGVSLPSSVLAAPGDKARSYIVTLAIPGSDRNIVPSSRGARERVRARAERASTTADRLASEHGFKVRHRYGHAVTGFSARLTAAQAAEIASDAQVASIRPARIFRLAGQSVPTGIRRVKAAPTGAPGPDINADVAVIDTGVGPVAGNELNIVGGINCSGNPAAPGYDSSAWGDSYGHGTHVAGTIGARDNGVGVVGIAPGVRIWSVRIFSGGVTDETNVVCGLDWAVAQPGIDVINMSFEGPRLDYLENCGIIASTPGADPIHKAVCSAHAAGITMVAAAGNFSLDANTRSPGGYDQVISVAALADFDGNGWGNASQGGCGYNKNGDDKLWASSNFGKEIDIVAPGVCIESTARLVDAGDTETMTGTSMAAPHVTGAVARHIAKYGHKTPDRMRSIVRASGRLDWDATSDPLWSGIADPDEPNRVLDVAAIVSPPDVAVWLSHDNFKVGGSDIKRVTRADVQRLGGYAGAVTLNVAGLAKKVGSATFGRKTLPGLDALGTNVTLKIKTSAPDGTRKLRVVARGSGGEPSGSRDIHVIVDRTGPKILGPTLRFRDGRVRLGSSGAAAIALGWTATDKHSFVKRVLVQRKVGKGDWRTIAWPKGSGARATLKPGRTYRFRLKAVDGFGNRSKSAAPRARLQVLDSPSPRWVKPPTGGWQTLKAKPAVGGSFLATSGPAGAITTRVYGKGIAIVSPIAPGRGVMRVRIDGGAWVNVNLKAAAGSHRRVVFSRRLPLGVHKVEIEALQGPAAVDALLALR